MPVDRSCAAGWDRSKVIYGYHICNINIYIYIYCTYNFTHEIAYNVCIYIYNYIYIYIWLCKLCMYVGYVTWMWWDGMGWGGVGWGGLGWGGMWCIVHIDLHHHSNERLRPKGCADPQEDAEKVSPAGTSPRLRHLISLACHTRCGQPWLPLTTTSRDGKHM